VYISIRVKAKGFFLGVYLIGKCSSSFNIAIMSKKLENLELFVRLYTLL